jgi:argininosuccinate lyase
VDFTESVSFDHRLYEHDVRGSIAHAEMLATIGVLTPEEAEQIRETLEQIAAELRDGVLPLKAELEDIHMHIEQALIDRLGDVGRKLHTGRSRNDQVATDLRLWLRDQIDRLDGLLENLHRAFLLRCDQDAGVILPAYTHMQRAQPVLAAHYWLAYCEKFARDRQRLMDCRRRVNVCSLGCAAAAGTTIPLDRQLVADKLGFEGVAANSLDVSSDRDFVVESVFCLVLIAEHLSGWAEEWILWTTTEFQFLRLPHAFCTGSSIMPQKVNPDVAELIRGKTARVIGSLQALLVLIKGLPLAYNRDLQEDKPQLFDAVDTVAFCLELAAPLVHGAELNRERIAEGLSRGHLDATTLMEQIVLRGVPLRTAHHLVGKLVALANSQNCSLANLTAEQLHEATQGVAELDASLLQFLGVGQAVAAFRTFGSTNPEMVAQQILAWKQRLRMDGAVTT